MLTTAYKRASADIVFEEFDGDLVILNLGSGQYFGFNQSAGAIWGVMMSGVAPEKIAGFGYDTATIAEFVEKLSGFELIVPDPVTESKTSLDAAEIKALNADPSTPVIEVYDDLADLIVADPIHDVDEQAGWPNVPATD